jgi:DNA-directed RNA polymerase subunit RPC12/RpoP
MPSMFENAVASIRMGVEDYQQQDSLRDLSAVRNFYAGILLLAKELLIRSAPNADGEVVIAAKIKPAPDGGGGIIAVPDGKNSIDYNQIKSRFKDFSLTIDTTALDNLGAIRKDIEHKDSRHSNVAVRGAITSTFAVVTSLFRQMQEDPADVLSDVWQVMLSTKEVYDAELKSARDTLSAVLWYSDRIDQTDFKCLECGSSLVAQLDETNIDQANLEFMCRSCGDAPDFADMMEDAIDKKFGGEAYTRAKETGDEGPIYQCPACQRRCLLEEDEFCANCNEQLDYDNSCAVCGGHIPISDYLDGIADGLCSYHAYQAERVMRE